MPFSIQHHAHGTSLELEGELTIRDAMALAASVAQIPAGDGIRVLTARLHDADTSVLQILCSLRHTNQDVSFGSVSAGFAAAVDRCGLRRELLSDAAKRESGDV
jgi:ABC-type transporter Mla MlaB component